MDCKKLPHIRFCSCESATTAAIWSERFERHACQVVATHRSILLCHCYLRLTLVMWQSKVFQRYMKGGGAHEPGGGETAEKSQVAENPNSPPSPQCWRTARRSLMLSAQRQEYLASMWQDELCPNNHPRVHIWALLFFASTTKKIRSNSFSPQNPPSPRQLVTDTQALCLRWESKGCLEEAGRYIHTIHVWYNIYHILP